MDPVFKVLAVMRDQTDRLMAADRLEELGRPETARLLRDPDVPPLVLCDDLLLAVRLVWTLNGAHAVQLFNPDGGRPTAHLTPEGPWRTWKGVPLGVARRLRSRVVKFQFLHNNWSHAARRPPKVRSKVKDDGYVKSWAAANHWWVLALSAQQVRDFWEAVRIGLTPPSRAPGKQRGPRQPRS